MTYDSRAKGYVKGIYYLAQGGFLLQEFMGCDNGLSAGLNFSPTL